MLEWIARGLGKGIVTSRYPHRHEPNPDDFRGSIRVLDTHGATPELEGVCPTGAIRVRDGKPAIDRGRCMMCGLCVAADPARFAFVGDDRNAARSRGSLVVGDPTPAAVDGSARTLADQSRTLRRSIHVRHVDAGSDGSEEWEISALANPYYDMQRLGLFFTASPRHADILLVSGGVTRSMRTPLERAYDVMPQPKAVVAAGTDACSGGLSAATGETAGGVDKVLPVDIYVPGAPPSPIALLHGLLLAAGMLKDGEGR